MRAAQEGARVVGIDLDEPSIASAVSIAARRFPSLEITYVNGPLEDVDGGFDLIMTNEVLEHVVDLRACLEDVRKRLRPGGRFTQDGARCGTRRPGAPADGACRKGSGAVVTSRKARR